MDVLVAHAVDAVACHGDAALLGCLGLTPEQARLYLADLTALPPLPSFAEAIDVAERFRTIDEIQAMVRGGEHARDWDLEALGALHNAAIDWSLVLRRTNEYCDNIVAALRLTRYADRAARLQEIELEFDAEEAQLGPLRPIWSALLLSGRESVSRKFALKWLDESMGAPSSLCALEACAVARLQLSRLGFALAAYHADHGAFPESLGALVPENLSAAPLDPYTDLPFVYERNDDGYRLYSVGENMLDDGGRTFDSEPRGDDILIEVPRRARPATGTHSATP
jgi:hypothetical protein